MERLAFDQPQLAHGRPFGEEPSSSAHDEWFNQEAILVNQARPLQRLDQGCAAVDNDVFARLLFQFGNFFHHIFSVVQIGLENQVCQN